MSTNKLYFRGDNIFLYNSINVKPNDTVGEVKVRVLKDENGQIYEELPWTNMENINSTREYFYNYKISYESDYGQYQVIYSTQINGNNSYFVESFFVIPKSDKYVNFIKLYGYIHEARSDASIGDVSITITNTDTQEVVATALSIYDGKWESFVYPGNYLFSFYKFEYDKEELQVQIGDEHNEIQFNNIGLLKSNVSFRGNGVYKIGEGQELTTKQGTPLNGLQVSVFDVYNPMEKIAYDITDNEGNWYCFLNEGNYLLKINGFSFGVNFDKTMRLKVMHDGNYYVEDISNNITNNDSQMFVDNGTGEKNISDTIVDKKGNPLINVQVNAYHPNDLNNIIAQDYTDLQGKWSLNLNIGTYIIEYYHPSFKTITENKVIS